METLNYGGNPMTMMTMTTELLLARIYKAFDDCKMHLRHVEESALWNEGRGGPNYRVSVASIDKALQDLELQIVDILKD